MQLLNLFKFTKILLWYSLLPFLYGMVKGVTGLKESESNGQLAQDDSRPIYP